MGTATKGKRRGAKKAATRKRARPAAAVEIPAPDEVLGPIGAELTEKQHRFCVLVAANPNATEAYQRAFENESRRAAAVEASKLLKMPAIAETVATLRKELLDRFNVTNERIIEEYAYCAFFDIAEIYDDKGKLLPVHDMPPHARRAIAGIEMDELFEGTGKDREQIGFTSKVKTVGKRDALQDLAKIRKMLNDKTEISLSESLEALVAGSWKVPEGGANA